MQFTPKKIDDINTQDIDKVFESPKGYIIVTKSNGLIDIYQSQQEQLELVKTYQHHQGQIMDVAFASLNFNSYFVTVSYDRSLNVYDLDNLQDESLFKYQEEDSQIGYLSHVCFSNNNPKELRFLVGTSNGYILDFNSSLNFEPSKHRIFDNGVSAIDVSCNGQIVVSSVGHLSKLFTTFSFQTFIEFGEVFPEKNKISLLKFNKFSIDNSCDELIMISDNNKVYVWKCDKDQMEVVKLSDWNLDQKCLSVQWQLGGFSANLITLNKDDNNFDVMKLGKSYEQDSEWFLDTIRQQ